jgi:transcriptional regulator GlxA family with amidase domain
MSLVGGEIESRAGVRVASDVAVPDEIDTLFVVGGAGMADREVSPETIAFIRAAAAKARRTAAFCLGAFPLAASGLLDGRRATTHWRYAATLQARYPAVKVEGDRIFLNERGVWTSAGMTAGIDMTLALIEEDLGRELSREVARMLVVYYQRPGGQVQHSSLLDLDPGSDRIRSALTFAREHLSEPLSVERLAEAAHLSVRQFSRAFVSATGMTPAKAIERMRVEAARPQVEDGRQTLDAIAQAVGFVDAERMRQSFVRILGYPPRSVRRAVQQPESQS